MGDPELAGFLRRNFPGPQIIEGDAAHLPGLLVANGIERIAAVVSSLPLLSLPGDVVNEIVSGVFEALPVDDPKQRKPDISLARELLGWSLGSVSGAVGHARIHDGTQLGAPIVGTSIFPANTSDTEFFPDQGIVLNSGAIFLEVVAGSLEGAVFYA